MNLIFFSVFTKLIFIAFLLLIIYILSKVDISIISKKLIVFFSAILCFISNFAIINIYKKVTLYDENEKILNIIEKAEENFISKPESFQLQNYYNPYDIRFETSIISKKTNNNLKQEILKKSNLSDEQKVVYDLLYRINDKQMVFKYLENFIIFDINTGAISEIILNKFSIFLNEKFKNLENAQNLKCKIKIFEIKGYISVFDEKNELFRINFIKNEDDEFFIDKNLGKYNLFQEYVNQKPFFTYINDIYQFFFKNYSKIKNIESQIYFNNYFDCSEKNSLKDLKPYVIFQNFLEYKPLNQKNEDAQKNKKFISNILDIKQKYKEELNLKQFKSIFLKSRILLSFYDAVSKFYAENICYVQNFENKKYLKKLNIAQTIDNLKYIEKLNVMRIYDYGIIFNRENISKFKYNFEDREITSAYTYFNNYIFNQKNVYKKHILNDNIANVKILIFDLEKKSSPYDIKINITYDILDEKTFDILETKSFVGDLKELEKYVSSKDFINYIKDFFSNTNYLEKQVAKNLSF